MLNRRKELEDAELEAENFLASRGAAEDVEIAGTKAAVSASRAASDDTIKTAAAEAAARYGLSPDVVAATVPGLQLGNEDLDSKHAEAMAFQKVRQRQQNMNRVANFAFQRLVAAGFDAKEARRVAIQYALDEDRRKAESASNAKARQVASEKSDIVDYFTKQRAEAARKYAEDRKKSAILNSVMRTFFGLAGSVGTAYALGPASAATKVAAAGAGGAAANTMSGNFVPDDDAA